MNAPAHLQPRIASAFYGRFPQLRPAQEAAIPPLLSGKNVVLASATGTGKTEAVFAPLVQVHLNGTHAGGATRILYVAPTKALINDLARRLSAPLDQLGIQMGIRHGDRDDVAGKQPPQVVLTTPESLDVMMYRDDPALRGICAAVLDEVHLLYNSQRGLHLAILLHRFRLLLGRAIQWAALSATVGRLSDIRDFLFGPTEDAVFLDFSTCRQIDAVVERAEEIGKLPRLVSRMLDGAPGKLLVFTNSRKECERVAAALQDGGSAVPPVLTHYSSLAPEIRVATEKRFESLRSAVCVATSTLELGVDIGDVDAVVLWGVPSGVESFLQRIGRGSRRQPKSNVVCAIPDGTQTPLLDAIRFLALLDAARAGELSSRRPFELFGAVGQQCLSAIGIRGGAFTRVADLCGHFAHLPHVGRPQVEGVLDALAAAGYVQRHSFKNQFGGDELLHRLIRLRMIYGNVGMSASEVELRHGRDMIGSVPAPNLLRLHRGDRFRFAGALWTVRSVVDEAIEVEPSQSRDATIEIRFYGRWRGFDSFLAERVWRIIMEGDIPASDMSQRLRAEVEPAIGTLRSACTREQVPYSRMNGDHLYFTCAGYLANVATSLALGVAEATVDDLFLVSHGQLSFASIPKEPVAYERFLPDLCDLASDQSLFQTLLPVDLQVREAGQMWMKDESNARALERLASATPIEVPQSVLQPLMGRERQAGR